MSNFLQSVDHLETTCGELLKNSSINKRITNISKSKENIFHHKYRKDLKKKLKKYRLRPDGQEDPLVLDVSRILLTSLRIKSPNSKEPSPVECSFQNELIPKNYLFKMGRRKLILSKKTSDASNLAIANDKLDKNVNDISSISQVVKKIDDLKNGTETDNNIVTKNNNDLLSIKENDKKQTNAFKVLMESRNKSIGSNSPGKEKVLEECKPQESIEKRNEKAKRTLLLQKMAEAKGSIKKKEIEEYQDKVIKKKLEKRAERFKSLILKYDSKSTSEVRKQDVLEKLSVKVDSQTDADNKAFKHHKIQLVDIFQQSTEATEKSKIKYVIDEDVEFLKKLSPSLKKRENMLCYFKKIEKDNNNENEDESVDNGLIKVKFTSKLKKKAKKKTKLSLNKQEHDDLINMNCTTNFVDINHGFTEKKENVLSKQNSNTRENNCINIKDSEVEVSRPRRNIKRPAKYIDEVLTSSSDEELHIFTPKKKKHIDNQNEFRSKVNKNKIETNLSLEVKKESIELDTIKSKKVKIDRHKKPAKLAPIFNAKPQLDASALEAKLKFLHSGVPDKLKKVVEKQSVKNTEFEIFNAVVHVQQKNHEPLCIFNFDKVDYTKNNSDDDLVCDVKFDGLYKSILKLENQQPKINYMNVVPTDIDIQKVLLGMKKYYPKFPVYRTYRLLKDKNRGEYRDNSYLDHDNSVEIINGMSDVNIESPDRLNWTDKYKPMSSKELIGNFEATKELKKWLISWTENDIKTKKHDNIDSDSSDFYYSDTDSKDSVKFTNNLLILNGPVGSGKTSIVYAVATELAIKVLEVNASSKRTGKIMLQDLQEATQSHKVNRGKTSSQENSQKCSEVIEVKVSTKHKKRGRPKKPFQKSMKKKESVVSNDMASQSQSSQDNTRTCMSLILIDDADIVFEQDDGFCSAIVQLVHCSKRPVILITSSTSCLHLQRFLQTAKNINIRPLQPKMLGMWLDIMCLVENNKCLPGLGAQLLDYFHGDIRKSINYLQFYFPKDNLTNDNLIPQCNDLKFNVDDENSSMSWTDRETIEEKNDGANSNYIKITNISQCLLYEKNKLYVFEYPVQLFKIWWNVPNLINNNLQEHKAVKEISKQSNKSLEIEALSKTLDAISISDYCRKKHFNTDITDSPWRSLENGSVSERETLDNYNNNEIIADEITHALVTGSIVNAQKALAIDHNGNLEFPGINVRSKGLSLHKEDEFS
ncbi:unnamed protein product [Diatraea saccharalis]|uniref:ATPase AAA-type core domain-containing protein n=1 Tax=Diatraea saccharalis TaxID=40085 RepID=A0A9P0CBI0_9NEOP|nr:unnamed protein product [Diatraea saccharalis]